MARLFMGSVEIPTQVAVPEAAVHEAPYFPDKETADFLEKLGMNLFFLVQSSEKRATLSQATISKPSIL